MVTNSPASDPDSAFPATQWTVIVQAVSTDPEHADLAQKALETLCAAYREPIVKWFRRNDYKQDPEDLAHSFIEYLIEKNLLKKVAPRTRRFRFFLAASMRYFLRDTWDKNGAQIRGGDAEIVSFAANDIDVGADGQVDSQLDLDLALDIHRKVMKALAPPEALKPYIFQKDSSEGWDEIAARLGITPDAVRQRVHRLREQHWVRFSDEVTQITTPEDHDKETRYLYELLLKHLPAE